MQERRKEPFAMDEAKFSTQRVVTYVMLLIFSAVVAYVFYGDDQAERSTVLQTVINFTMLTMGFWLGSSKGAADNRDALNKMLTPQSDRTVVSTPSDATVTTTQPVKDQP